MHKPIGSGALVLIVGSAVLINSSIAHAQVWGALQYPPASVGEDAQPPPPARMAPQSVSPRRIELGVSGSSQPPANHPFRVQPPADIDRHLTPPAPAFGASPIPPPSDGGD